MPKRFAPNGLPFLEHNARLPTLTETLQTSRYGVSEQAAYRLPVAFLLAGDSGSTRRQLAAEVDKLADRTDAAANVCGDRDVGAVGLIFPLDA